MNADDLTPEQLTKIFEQLGPLQRYLRRLTERMHQEAFPPDDELYAMAKEAHSLIHRLAMTAHYKSCRNGVGRPARD